MVEQALLEREPPTYDSASRYEPIMVGWEPRHALLWGQQPLRLHHRLDRHPLFSPESLEALIERYPSGRYMLVHVGARGEEKLWREGEFGALSGRQVIEAIAQGRMWLNLLHVHAIDPHYGDLLDQVFEEIRAQVPGHERVFNRINGILISSPAAQVYYHFDTAGQSLWQIAGHKRVFVYPPVPPFLRPEELEAVCCYHGETSIGYESWYDDYATVFEIGPGEMLSWPLNAPHRIENLGFSISMTVEYATPAIRRNLVVNSANCLLREYLGIQPRQQLTGAGFYLKAGLFGAVRASGALKQRRRQRRPVTFRLDPDHPGRTIEIA